MIANTDGVIHWVRTPYNYNRDEASKVTGLECKDEHLAQQQFKDECDINVIVERFGVTGKLPLTTMQPMAGDFTSVEDFQSAVNSVKAAEANFMTLPSKIREKFLNRADKFVDFCIDPANIEEVRAMGLAPRPAQPTMAEIKDGQTT